MRIEIVDDENLIIYYSLILDDILEYEMKDIKTFIQMLVLKIRKNYNLELKGYYHLDVYIKKIVILEFHKIDDYEDEIDLNIVVHTNTPILVEFDDYFLIPNEKYYYNEKYYIPINEIDYVKYIEFIDIIYNKKAKEILQNGILI